MSNKDSSYKVSKFCCNCEHSKTDYRPVWTYHCNFNKDAPVIGDFSDKSEYEKEWRKWAELNVVNQFGTCKNHKYNNAI